jgi:signal transduction histidine kinase
VVSVRDHGIGIPEEEHDLVFSPFMRSASALSRSHEGTGLGLSLVKAFMDMHDGDIKLDSEVSNGTTITLHFPSDRFVTE